MVIASCHEPCSVDTYLHCCVRQLGTVKLQRAACQILTVGSSPPKPQRHQHGTNMLLRLEAAFAADRMKKTDANTSVDGEEALPRHKFLQSRTMQLRSCGETEL